VYGHEWQYSGTLLSEMFAEVGLVKVITKLHGTAIAPATHQWGRLPINRIYVSKHLQDEAKAGYLTFGEGVPSDHRELWLNLPAENVLQWITLCNLQGPTGSSVMTSKSSIVTIWYWRLSSKNCRFFDKLSTLQNEIHGNCLTKYQSCRFENID